MRRPVLPLLAAALLGACASGRPPVIAYDETPVEAVRTPEPPRPVEIVRMPEPLPLPGQLQPAPAGKAAPEPRNPRTRVDRANEAARMQPAGTDHVNAIQVWPYSEGALYQLYTTPGRITDIVLQEGEDLVENGAVAAGDTARWIIGDTVSGEGPTRRVHILVKPVRSDLPVNNLLINTTRRTYHLELRATEGTYMASASWHYPRDELIALERGNREAEAAAPVAAGIDLDSLRFRYRITGDHPPWRPLRAFDDGAKVYIELPRGVAQGELPPLFAIGPEGGGELVNYRVRGNWYVVDRLFAAAELRLGASDQQVVRIERTDGRGWTS